MITNSADPLGSLALTYSPKVARGGVNALFALDEALGHVLRTTTQPVAGQLRLAWWRETLAKLDVTTSPAEPVLEAIARDALPLGVVGSELSRIADGWEILFDELSDDALTSHATERGSVLFKQAGIVIGAGEGDPLEVAGRAWALADVARNISDPKVADRARTMAGEAFGELSSRYWTRRGRGLGALALSARLALAGPPRSWWVARLAWHRLTGR